MIAKAYDLLYMAIYSNHQDIKAMSAASKAVSKFHTATPTVDAARAGAFTPSPIPTPFDVFLRSS